MPSNHIKSDIQTWAYHEDLAEPGKSWRLSFPRVSIVELGETIEKHFFSRKHPGIDIPKCETRKRSTSISLFSPFHSHLQCMLSLGEPRGTEVKLRRITNFIVVEWSFSTFELRMFNNTRVKDSEGSTCHSPGIPSLRAVGERRGRKHWMTVWMGNGLWKAGKEYSAKEDDSVKREEDDGSPTQQSLHDVTLRSTQLVVK